MAERHARALRLAAGCFAAAAATAGFEAASRMAERAYARLLGASTVTIVLVPLALAALALVARRLRGGVGGSGVPEVVAACATEYADRRREWASLPSAAGRGALTLAALACGASVGRQGPSVSLGAALAHAVVTARQAALPPDFARTALSAGAAAGVAAAYNAPIAGVLFGLEQLGFQSRSRLLWTGVGAIAGSLVAWTAIGSAPHFAAARVEHVDGSSWVASMSTAIVAGVCGAAFARAVTRLPDTLSSWRAGRPFLCAVAGASVIALLSLATAGAISGTGEGEIARMVSGGFPSLAYPLAKAIATLAAFWIGLAGGLFGPSIAIGSGVGNALSALFHGAPIALLVLSGMAAFLASATRTPLTAAAFAVESSGQYPLAPVLIAAALVGHLASALTRSAAIYSTPARRLLAASPASD